MQPLRLWVFLAFIAGLRAYELSPNLAEFYCVVNGNYSDQEQVEKDGSNRSSLTSRLVPLLAPQLSRLPCIYVEEFSDDTLIRAVILIVTEGEDGVSKELYRKHGHQVTNPKPNPTLQLVLGSHECPSSTRPNVSYISLKYISPRPGSFDVSKINSFTPADLQGRQDCKDAFERNQPHVFTVNYALCKQAAVNGQRPSYSGTFTCREAVIVSPAGAPEKSTLVPYRVKSQGDMYPLEGAPSNYDCKCGQTNG